MGRKPKLGQNFLNNTAAAIKIVDALGNISDSTVVEIGPGTGAITNLLAPKARHLIAVELDRNLAPMLSQRFADRPSVEVLEQDILTTDISALQQSAGDKLRVLGNLPYYITSDILLHLFQHNAAIDRAVLMMQREVADRVAAHPGTRDYGLLSCTTQLHAQVEKLFTLPPSAFTPPPDVYSTVVRLTMAPRFAELGVDSAGFIAFLKQSFAQKRKTLSNNLRAAGYELEASQAAFIRADIDPHARSEALPIESAARLYLELKSAATS